MDLLAQPLADTEFLAVDCETNGRGGEDCELTEVGAVLVGGGELHESVSSLVAVRRPLPRGVQRFTGITQAMLDGAPGAEGVLAALLQRLAGRVLVAHNASFDRRVLMHACRDVGAVWPDPPVLCTVALARRLLPLQRERRLAVLADALGIEVVAAHRALADAQTCGRVLCALLPRLRAHATTVGDAVALLGSRPRGGRGVRRRGPRRDSAAAPAPGHAAVDFAALPRDPGVYIFRDGRGAPLYVGKSVCVASRARAHFAPSGAQAPWTAHAEIVDYQATGSELGALVLENRLIKALAPPGNVRLARRRDASVYLRCRLDAAYPVLEVGADPAPGLAVNVGPVHGRRRALELVEQLDSLFGLRHCGRHLARRRYPSAYGQMGRCLSPCLGDLDPNLYRARLDSALELFAGHADGRQLLLDHVESQMRAAASSRCYERAAALRRRLGRLRSLLASLGGVLRATHARPVLAVVAHPRRRGFDALWIVDGRVRDWERLAPAATRSPESLSELEDRTSAAVGVRARGAVGAPVAVEEIDEVRIVAGWLEAHPLTPTLVLEPRPSVAALGTFLDRVTDPTDSATRDQNRRVSARVR